MPHTNVQLSKNENLKIQQAYNNSNQNTLYSSVIHKNAIDEFNENHSFKVTHILIIAGITYILLKNYQRTEPPFSDFVTSA